MAITGQLGLIIPNKALTADYGRGIRKLIADHGALAQIVDFQDAQVFPEASIYACLLFLSGSPLDTSIVGIAANGQVYCAEQQEVPTPEFTSTPWSLGYKRAIKPATAYHTLGQTCSHIFQGLISGADSFLIGRPSEGNPAIDEQGFPAEQGITKPLLKGKDIRRFRIQPSGDHVIYPYDNENGKTRLLSEDELKHKYPKTYAYLSGHRQILDSRGSGDMQYPAWYALWNPRQIERFKMPKLLTQVLANQATFAIDPVGEFWFVGGGNAGVYGIVPKPDLDVDMWFFLAYLNSTFFDQHVKSISSRFRGGFYSYAKRFIQDAPIRVTGFSAVESEIVTRISGLVRSSYEQPTFESSIWLEIDTLITKLHAA